MKTLQERVKAQDPKLTVKQLDKLSRSRDFRVRMAVAKHPNTSVETIVSMKSKEKTPSVLKAINLAITVKATEGVFYVGNSIAPIPMYSYIQEDLSPEMSTVNTMILRDSALDIESVMDRAVYPTEELLEYPNKEEYEGLFPNHKKISTWALRVFFVALGVVFADFFIFGGN